ncbi:transposase [Patescibacteria group bacterium]|nr:transposase [Patescibacteria group bacterium]MCG2694468.1 transposase [Candidatus Parcubacteria bacterium]
MRKIKFENNEYYHIYNRGTDKRRIFDDKGDLWRFVKGILIFNRIDVVGSIRDELDQHKIHSNRSTVDFEELVKLSGGLVEVVCFCLNPNHYHLLVKQVSDDGISKFIQRLGSGYTRYFNEKNTRNGVLFQGKFKAVYVKSNEQLLYTSAYVSLNNKIHNIEEDYKNLVFSSWSEYSGENKVLNMCKGKDIILGQFDNFQDYKEFAESVVESARRLKVEKKQREDHLE